MPYPVQLVSINGNQSKVKFFKNQKEYYQFLFAPAGRFMLAQAAKEGKFVICRPGMNMSDFMKAFPKLSEQYEEAQLSKLSIQWIGFRNAVFIKGDSTPEAWAWRKLCTGRPVSPEMLKIWKHPDGSCGLHGTIV